FSSETEESYSRARLHNEAPDGTLISLTCRCAGNPRVGIREANRWALMCSSAIFTVWGETLLGVKTEDLVNSTCEAWAGAAARLPRTTAGIAAPATALNACLVTRIESWGMYFSSIEGVDET